MYLDMYEACTEQLKKTHNERRGKFWALLPSGFVLSPWEELTKEKGMISLRNAAFSAVSNAAIPQWFYRIKFARRVLGGCSRFP